MSWRPLSEATLEKDKKYVFTKSNSINKKTHGILQGATIKGPRVFVRRIDPFSAKNFSNLRPGMELPTVPEDSNENEEEQVKFVFRNSSGKEKTYKASANLYVKAFGGGGRKTARARGKRQRRGGLTRRK